jgi:methylenetetrahydrofolate--tRNA-(uracil-5-)-methyltransferase
LSSGPVTVIGAGLAGSEAAWQLLRRGVGVELHEMRPGTMTPAHVTGHFAELVCSNSLGSEAPSSAAGLLKEELRAAGSLVLGVAEECRVPAGRALAVDRLGFARAVEGRLLRQPGLQFVRRESRELPKVPVSVVATGPLTSPALAAAISAFTGADNLSFVDAIAPIVIADSVDAGRLFWGARYRAGVGDYLNCPLNRGAYLALWGALKSAEQHPRHDFEHSRFFEGCLPIEELARRGEQTMRFGPLKPVGLIDPRSGRRPYAAVQLRREDREGRLLNLVGFQTNLTFAAQRRVFRMIPGLEQAEFARLGAMHRNTYLRGPDVLLPTMESRRRPGLFFGGQLTGVEGYLESTASGLVAGAGAAARAVGSAPREFPHDTMIGALCAYAGGSPSPDFQPMNANWGLLPPLPGDPPRKERPALFRARAMDSIGLFLDQLSVGRAS